jgi:hypothetical protein
VRVKPHTTPQSGWRALKRTWVGIVKEYDSKQNKEEEERRVVHVVFKDLPDSHFLEFELERVFRVGDVVEVYPPHTILTIIPSNHTILTNPIDPL